MKSKIVSKKKSTLLFDPIGEKDMYNGDIDDLDSDELDQEESFDDDFVYADELALDKKDVADEDEEAVVTTFLRKSESESRTLADIIMQKLQEKSQEEELTTDAATCRDVPPVPDKVVTVYQSVGKLLQHYRSGRLPKALKMLPHIKNWEYILWITRPDLWSAAATFMVTRIFSSNLNVHLVQRFLNMVLLEKCREDIRLNNKLNYHLYMALKKALFKPGAFYKGILLPLAQCGSCTLREAKIFSSVLVKVSIPSIHSAAALLKLLDLPYYGSTSVFIKILLQKKYALPMRVVDAVVEHFVGFSGESRCLPVVWQQALLVFVQRYKHEFSVEQQHDLLSLIRIHGHNEISPEIRRELLSVNLK